MVKRDFVKLLLPAVVAGEFYAPDTRGYKELSDAVVSTRENNKYFIKLIFLISKNKRRIFKFIFIDGM